MFNYKPLTLITLSIIFSSQALAQEPQSTPAPVEKPLNAPSAPVSQEIQVAPVKPAEPVHAPTPTEPVQSVTQPIPAPAPVEPEKTVTQPAPAPAIATEQKPAKAVPPAKKAKRNHKKKTETLTPLVVIQEWDIDYDNSKFVTRCDEEQTLGYLGDYEEVYVPTDPTANEPESVTPMTHEAPDIISIDQDPYNFSIFNQIHKWHRSHDLDKPSVYHLVFAEGDVDLSDEKRVSMTNVIREIMSRPGANVFIHSFGYVSSDNTVDSRRAALQRAIKVRKLLIENDINPNNISVNAIEDLDGRNNKIEILVEGHHAKDASIRPNVQY